MVGKVEIYKPAVFIHGKQPPLSHFQVYCESPQERNISMASVIAPFIRVNLVSFKSQDDNNGCQCIRDLRISDISNVRSTTISPRFDSNLRVERNVMGTTGTSQYLLRVKNLEQSLIIWSIRQTVTGSALPRFDGFNVGSIRINPWR